MLRNATRQDCGRLARLYADNLPNDLPCRLGQRFLAGLFEIVIAAPATAVVVAERGGMLLGFCVITRARQAINRSLISKLAGALLLRPAVLIGIVLQALNPSFLKSLFGEPDRDTADWREVYLIAVSQQARGGGLGSKLLEMALAAGPAEIPCLAKTMDDGAAIFYQSMGFVPMGTEKRGSRSLTVLGRKEQV
ncbi:MAG: GNAT family N-acetyltransferase [Bacteroidales bacterium]